MPYVTKITRLETVWNAHEAKADADPVGSFASRKNGRFIPVFSPRDDRFCGLAEHAARITSYEERPDLLMLDDNGRMVPFVVDFAVMMDRRRILVALSLTGKTPCEEEARILMLAKAHCAWRGAEFVHISDYDLIACDALGASPPGSGDAVSKTAPRRRRATKPSVSTEQMPLPGVPPAPSRRVSLPSAGPR
jgi:hypothetical protein